PPRRRQTRRRGPAGSLRRSCGCARCQAPQSPPRGATTGPARRPPPPRQRGGRERRLRVCASARVQGEGKGGRAGRKVSRPGRLRRPGLRGWSGRFALLVEQCPSGLSQEDDGLLAANAREVVEELIQAAPS